MVCGALAFHASEYSPKAKSALIVGNGGALVAILLAIACRNTKIKRGDQGYKLMMASVHVALIYPLLFSALCSWRLSKAWAAPDKAYLIPYLFSMAVAGVISSVMIFVNKPKKGKGEAARKLPRRKAGSRRA